MKPREWLRPFLIAWIAFGSLLTTTGPTAAEPPLPAVVEFNRDVRPILADNCFACHGPDKNQRKADLRLDLEEGARADRGGYAAVVPGKPEQSELVKRVTAEDVKERMPPAKFGKKPTPRQSAILRRWVEQGGRWQKHWSLLPARRTPLPKTAHAGWPINPIDDFILAQLEQEGLTPSPEADRRTLARRLAFDLTGLPPKPEEVEAFLADASPEAYEKLVDRLLASEHYGERMALYWLDLVRYADTAGYHSDNHRDVAPYRDYVIQAFDENKPFDRFTIEQLAGDLLPHPTPAQKIASGYNRLLQTTEEGGAQAKEYLAKYAADRVRNASTVWLGTTLGCAECHDHKFDPFTTKEFYRFAAFFADLREKAVGRQDQDKLPTPEQAAELRRLDERIATVQKALAAPAPGLDEAQAKWEDALSLRELRKLPKNLAEGLLLQPSKRTSAQKEAVAAYFRGIAPQRESERRELAELQRQRAALDKRVTTTLISTAVPPRVMRVLPRGNWLDDSGEIVSPGVPASLPPLARLEGRATRLDLARWLVAADHPLVARVFVNRLWKLLFGQGLVKTLDDFGSQGTWPSHPELLDWLAVEFRESGWDVKHMLKLMALSRTYRQTSIAGEELRQRDPYNALLARQARFRLDAEMVRDNALAVSGLLVRQVGGTSVKPYQPAGYWSLLNFPVREYQNDKGVNLYRRGLYTYWCRTFPHPSLVAFDAPSREECTVERPRSNTPLQALVLLNDPIYVEAARAFAERMIRQGSGAVEGRIQFAYRQALCRPARPEEVQLLAKLYDQHLRQYQAEKQAAGALLGIGDWPAPKDIEAAELAAWTSVARRGTEPARDDHKELSAKERLLMKTTAALSLHLTRRAFLGRSSAGMGLLALASLLKPGLLRGDTGKTASDRWSGLVHPLHHAAKAKRVIYLYMAGGPSHLETLDYKPTLAKMHGQPMPESFTKGQPIAQLQGQKLNGFAPQHPFRKYGKSGQEICEIFPHLGTVADDLCIVRSLKTEAINHDPAHTFMNTGTTISGRPAMGSWLWYGLGSESDNLPGFVVLISTGRAGQQQPISARQWHSGFLPSRFQGVEFRSKGDPVHYVGNPKGVTATRQRDVVDAVQALNRLENNVVDDPEIATRIAQYEMAFRMQTSVPGLMDISDEPKEVLDLYGTKGGDGSFAANCLLARRLAERGVRFIQLYHRDWDHHGAIQRDVKITAGEVDQGSAALLTDLKRRGMLHDTLVIWGGEFGRTPMAQGNGRDHHIKGFSIWLAGGGIKGGITHGSTDELGYNAVEDVVHVHDLHATMLHLLGVDHKRLTYKFQGRDFRLTDVHGNVVKPILA